MFLKSMMRNQVLLRSTLNQNVMTARYFSSAEELSNLSVTAQQQMGSKVASGSV
jgi:hypothetical protein